MPRPIQSVCQRHAFAFPPGCVGSLRGQNDHVPPISAARQLPDVVSQGPRAVDERMEDLQQRLEEHRDAFR